MSNSVLWKIHCMEDTWPGLWRRWLLHQCATIGYPPWREKGFHFENGQRTDRRSARDWVCATNALKQIKPGDFVLAALPGRLVGRLGEVTAVRVNDSEWTPLVPKSEDEEIGQMGRRILVRWDLEHGPDDLDVVVQLPKEVSALGRQTIHRLGQPVTKLQKILADPANWVRLRGRFGYERALADYIAKHPHKLEEGLQVQPNPKLHQRVLRIRENRFRDRSRSDVLLQDRDGRLVIVECKQDSPTPAHVEQLRHYIKRLKAETGRNARGILVHGGAKLLDRATRRSAREHPRVEVVQYELDVTFARSC